METTKLSPEKNKQALKGCGACAGIFLLFIIFIAIFGGGNSSTEPTNTSKVQITEITTEDQMKEAFNSVFSSTNNTGEERIREVDIWKDDDGTSWVTVSYNASENLTSNMTRSSMWTDAKNFYQKVTPLLSKSFNGAVLNGWLKTTDAYGKVEYSQVMTVTMSRATWEKIAWDTFIKTNIPVVADQYVESPVFGN